MIALIFTKPTMVKVRINFSRPITIHVSQLTIHLSQLTFNLYISVYKTKL